MFPQNPPAAPRVLLTAFGPFEGRAVNGSTTLVRALAQQGIPEATLRTCYLPVEWDSVESRALPAVEAFRPDLLLGIGEGGPTRIALESLGRNLRRGIDEAGIEYSGEPIDATGPPARPARLHFIWDLETPTRFPLAISRDAGEFLCNNALYRYAGTTVPRVGFIHLPPQRDQSDADYVTPLLPVIMAVLRSNLDPIIHDA